ncbi:beta-mannanase [Paenibacillus tengchongensis]|uniref:beta-mannanase n=1 Tax=Paenibacillus tengchongensis TaxID=2608684 RepID=UPI00124D4C0B|nr:beta-mannanase [Paenibacillus tengchongensis]
MRYIDPAPDTPSITGVVSRVEERFCTLRWHWPDGLQAVCIHKAAAEGEGGGTPPLTGMKLYTREEYKANNGYRDRLDDIGLVTYTVFARLQENGEAVLVRQQDGGNKALVSAGKARIYYSITPRKALFGKTKTVHMTITAEVPVPKEALCYVKKRGGVPSSRGDGVQFPFVQDFAAGRHALPPIEIGKEDQVRIFFTDGRKYGQFYELVPE